MVLNKTLAEILADPILKSKLISTAQQRLMASDSFYKPRLDSFIRYFKIYKAIVDSVDDADEPNTGANYAFGIIEDSTAAVSESILNTGVPTPARGRRANHAKAAENFNAMMSAYFSSAQYQADYPTSVRGRMICGPSWEMDSWANRWGKGRTWKKVPSVELASDGSEQVVEVMSQEPIDVPIEVGYKVRFPSIFNMRPQPFVLSVEKMKWCMEIEERVSLEDLEAQKYEDPDTGKLVSFFDLTEIKAEKVGGVIIRPTEVETLTSHQDLLRQINDKTSKDAEDDSQGGIDEVCVVWHWETDRVYAVANGKWLIAYVENLYHKPRLPYRLKNCTPQNESLYGIGLIEPAESMFAELDDIHKLSMRNWVRIINKMVAYNPDNVPYADNDFKPRAGGRIRVRPALGGSVAGSIQAIDHQDVSRSMLTMESNTKGLIERALGVADYSPGVEGTKQDHDTLGGLEKIDAKVRKRVASIRRQELASFVRQMENAEMMHSQFLVDKTPFVVPNKEGAPQHSEFDLWDIDTGGEGFDYVIEYDPAFGDDAMARQQGFILLDVAIKYNQAEAALKGPNAVFCEIAEIMRKILKSSGYNDTSNIMKRADGVKDPATEFQMMMQGLPTPIQPLEDMLAHYAEHVKQFNDPALKEAVAKGAAPADVLVRLQAHIQATGMTIQMALQNPQALIQQRGMAQQALGAPQGGGPTAQMAPGAGVAAPPKSPSPSREQMQ